MCTVNTIVFRIFSKYQYKGEMAYMAFTVFKPVHARRCFPRWDEPDFKVIIIIRFIDSLETQSMILFLEHHCPFTHKVAICMYVRKIVIPH